MDFERLKRSHKKQIIIGALAVCVIGGALTFATTRAKYKLTEDLELAKGTINYKPYDFKVMAMYQSEDKTNYTEIDKTPGPKYKINEEKSYCTINNVDKDNNAKIYTDKYGQHIFKNLSKNDKCYIYFDKNTETVSTILGNIEVNNYTPDFSKMATTDEGIYGVYDEMYGGTSYYWRGAATTNYLKFAGFCWRIVRINGDGTIRLIYDGTTCHQNGEVTENSIAVQNVAYNTNYNQSNYVGWTYEGALQRPTDNTTGTPSNAKIQTESWFNSNIIGADAEKVADGKYCNDRNVGTKPLEFTDTWSKIWSATGTQFVYAALDRLSNKWQPTLNCDNGDEYALKVGLITADEATYAGGKYAINELYYLYNGMNYWTMSPRHWNFPDADMFSVYLNGSLEWSNVNNSEVGIRPVINLKSDITISSGNGTIDNPYMVS